jgi:hypothetical protein
MTLGSFWRLGLVTASGVLALVNACAGSSFSASPNESGGSDAGKAAMAGEDNSGGMPDRGGGSAGGASGLGGASNDGGSLAESGASGAAEPSAAGGGVGGTDTAAAGSAGAAGECSAVAWFPDADGDGFGRASGQVLSCDPPAVGKWAAKAGDCDDDNNAVFLKEPDFEASSYTATSNGLSFDYDCSNKEESDPTQLGAAPACASMGILNCVGSGFANTARTGPGVNPLCGSKSLVTCMKSNLSCVGVTTMTTEGVRCR